MEEDCGEADVSRRRRRRRVSHSFARENQAKLVHLVVVEQILRATLRADDCLGAISSRFAPLYDRTVTRMITLAEMQKDLTNDRADRSLAVLVDARRAGVLHRLSSLFVTSLARDARRVGLKLSIVTLIVGVVNHHYYPARFGDPYATMARDVWRSRELCEERAVARHPWVAEADTGIRWGVQLITPNEPDALANLIKTAGRVEELGYDLLSIFDHPLMHVDPWIALSGLATRTSRVRLGSTVNCAVYRHPAHLARLATDLDNLSNGRHVLGLGSGWLKPEFEALGRDFGTFADRSAALEDTLAIVHGVWEAAALHLHRHEVQHRQHGCRTTTDPATAAADHGRGQRRAGHTAAGRAVGRRLQRQGRSVPERRLRYR